MSLFLIVLFPFIGFLVNGLIQMGAARLKLKSIPFVSGVIASVAMVASFGVSAYFWSQLKTLPIEQRVIEEVLFKWIHLGAINLDFAFRFDSLSAVFVLIITAVGALIHIYSIGYMSHDETPARYFSYLNLFCVMMLILVLGTTLPLVFLGWEGVGLASYLLIGYWFEDFNKVKAGQKAFIMNRIGDFGFLLAIFVAFQYAGSFDLLQINGFKFEPSVATLFGMLIFFACTGKSAQIPLFTWLPDAMAGPTPVSALIHAATMVTSGIYLLTRLSVVISSSSTVLMTIAVVGAATAFMAATIACAQSDIKKILAYSTISQLGFMFLACGVTAFDAAVFHVMTHAFFKALLFLGAGSVIHALHDEQNIFKMGNLRKKLPYTFGVFMVGWAAIIGVPPLSGFFSKDEILYQSLVSPYGSIFVFVPALAAAFLTAFYMTRMIVVVFFGSERSKGKQEFAVHESPWIMLAPLVVLAVLSFAGGWFGSPYSTEHHVSEGGGHGVEYGVMAGSVISALVAAWFAHKKYSKFSGEEKSVSFLEQGWKVDKIYDTIFVKGTRLVSTALSTFIEEEIIQRASRWAGSATLLSGTIIRSIQVGSVQAYIMMMVLVLTFILFLLTYGVGQYGKL